MHSVLLFFVISGSWPNPLDWPWRGMQCGLCLISVEEKTLHQLLKRYHFPHEVDTKNHHLKSGLLLFKFSSVAIKACVMVNTVWTHNQLQVKACSCRELTRCHYYSCKTWIYSCSSIVLFANCRRYRYIWKTWLSTLIMDTGDALQEKCS